MTADAVCPTPGEPALAPVVVQVLATRDRRGAWTDVTRELLSDGAALARRLSGRLSAWVLDAAEPDQAATADYATLAQFGCEQVSRLQHPRFSQGSSEAVAAALQQSLSLACRVVLLPGTARGEETAGLLAERIGSLWIPDALTLAVTRTGAVEVTAVEPGGKLSRTHRAAVERPLVVTIRPGVAEAKSVAPASGTARSAATPVVQHSPLVQDLPVDLSSVPELTHVVRDLPADPARIDIAFARKIVAGGRGIGGPEGMELVRKFADALGASPAASRMAVDLGWAPASRQVGQTGKLVKPDLYVACGISGASHHLAGMCDSKHIVAINSDPAAPIHEVAHLSLHGDLWQLLPAIQARLVPPPPTTADAPASQIRGALLQ